MKQKLNPLQIEKISLGLLLVILVIVLFLIYYHAPTNQNTCLAPLPHLSYPPFFYPTDSTKKPLQSALPGPLIYPPDTTKTLTDTLKEKNVYDYSDFKLWNGYDHRQNFQIILYNDPVSNARGLELGENVIAAIEDSLQTHGFCPALYYFNSAEWRVFFHPHEDENRIGAEIRSFNQNAYYVYNWRFFRPKPGLNLVKELVPYLLAVPN